MHTTTFRPERDRDVEWRWFAGGDWGYASPGAFTLLAAGPDRTMVARYCFKFNGEQGTRRQQGLTPFDAGVTFARKCDSLGAIPEWMALDPSAWAVTDGGPSIAEEVQRGVNAALQARAFPVIAAPKGPGSRVSGKLLLHEALKYTRPPGIGDDDPLPAWAAPRLRIHSEDASYLVETLPVLPRDKKNPEDVDTEADDHGYDSLRYALMARQPQVERDTDGDWGVGEHPGFEKRIGPDGTPQYVRRHRPTFGERLGEGAWQGVRRPGSRWHVSQGGLLTFENEDD